MPHPQALIKGRVSPTGYLHIKYGFQEVDGTHFGPYDIVIMPKDEDGSVSFALPQGIEARIEIYPGEAVKVVEIPRADTVDLDDLI